MEKYLFKSGSDWWNDAKITNGFADDNKWDNYALGYKKALEILSKKVIEDKENNDTLVFPIIFLYRHYLELLLKEIIENGNKYFGEEIPIPKTHEIMYLWSEAEKIIVKLKKGYPLKLESEIVQILSEFAKIDKGSYAFRYPIDTSGNSTLQGLERIGINNFVEKITPVIKHLESIACGIRVFLAMRA